MSSILQDGKDVYFINDDGKKVWCGPAGQTSLEVALSMKEGKRVKLKSPWYAPGLP